LLRLAHLRVEHADSEARPLSPHSVHRGRCPMLSGLRVDGSRRGMEAR
jgi:hypothetical protein